MIEPLESRLYDHMSQSREETMRILGFIILALVLGVGPASAWEEYKYPDQEVAIQFPATPTSAKSTYKSIYARSLSAMVYSTEFEHAIYRLTVIDLAGDVERASSYLNEAGYELMRQGNVIFTDFPRVYQDEKSIYGVTLTVDRKDGSRVLSTGYYHKGRLYIAEAVLPAGGDKATITPSRFVQTIRFPPDNFK
jgi:hypothetical protein